MAKWLRLAACLLSKAKDNRKNPYVNQKPWSIRKNAGFEPAQVPIHYP